MDEKPEKINLKNLREEARQEIKKIEEAASVLSVPSNIKDGAKIKAIWSISGAGSYDIALTETGGDRLYTDKPWGHWSDKRRLDHGALVICRLAEIRSGQKIDWAPDKEYSKKHIQKIQEIIAKFGPHLIYNGIEEQRQTLLRASGDRRYPVPVEKIFIPKGKVERTIDQVKSFRLPPGFDEGDDILGIVTHAPHYARLLRMINLRPFDHKVSIKLFPLVFEEGEEEFLKMELSGVIDYASRHELSREPYPYDI